MDAPAGDSYRVSDLVGCAVKTAAGEELGTLREVMPTGSNDVFVVEGEREYLIPALKSVVVEVDVAAKKITVSLPPGLRDIYEPPAKAAVKKKRRFFAPRGAKPRP